MEYEVKHPVCAARGVILIHRPGNRPHEVDQVTGSTCGSTAPQERRPS